MCLVSVIIPIYNGEEYLKKCLDSVRNQSLQNIEIICIDDGSTDNTSSILDKYSRKDERIQVICTENNGQGIARNIGLNIAKGDYIAFVDADDWIDLNCLELLYLNAKSNDLDLLFFQLLNYIDKNGEFVESDLYNHQCFDNNCIKQGMIFNHENTKDFLFEIPVCPVSKFYKKSFIDSNNLRFPEGFYFEDNGFFYNAFFKCNKASFLKEHLYFRRRHDNSVTQTFDESKFDIVKATNFILDVFRENNKYNFYKFNLLNHVFSMLVEWFKKSPFVLKQNFYNIIKNDFYGFNELKHDFENNLNKDFLIIFNLIINNEYYLDFLSNYKLIISDYVIFSDGEEYKVNTDKYFKFKSNQNDYKISIVIPIFNNEKFIHRTLMTIENQTFGIENLEVLMVNDDSSDNTYEVINEYADKYKGFKAIHIKNGTGSPGTPRNIGLKEATSNYVIFLDHDDLFEISALEVLYNSIIKNNSDFVYGTYVSIDVDLPTKIIYPNEKHGYFENIDDNERSIAFPPPSIWTKLFKRNFLLENNILFPTILGEDAIFISKALMNAKGITYLWDSIVCYHILDENSYTKKVSYKYLEEGFISEEYLYNFYKNECHENYYRIRSEGILDFYLSQFVKSNLNKNEFMNLFPLLYSFIKRIDDFGLKPHLNEENKLIFNYVIEKDINSILKFKNIVDLNDSKKIKIKKYLKKKLNKIKQFGT